jgi:hypothetical protein
MTPDFATLFGKAEQGAEESLSHVVPNEARNLLFATIQGKSRFLGQRPPSEEQLQVFFCSL